MWAYRTTIRTPTGQTLFALAFGIEEVAPTELVWSTARIDQFQLEANDKALFLAEEGVEYKKEEAAIRDLPYKLRMTRYHNERVAEKNLALGDLVLRNAKVTGVDQTKGKLSPIWEGPYVIMDEVRPGIFRLGYEDGQPIERTWHADNLEKYKR